MGIKICYAIPTMSIMDDTFMLDIVLLCDTVRELIDKLVRLTQQRFLKSRIGMGIVENGKRAGFSKRMK